MYLTMISYGFWFRRDFKFAVFFTAFSAFVSWPFAGLLGAPIAFDIVFRRKKIFKFVKWSFVSALLIATPQVLIDSYFYGKSFVFAPFNIVAYNVFTEHGPDLYGVEGTAFYLFNGILNFNVFFILALLSWPVEFIKQKLIPSNGDLDVIPRPLIAASMYLWLAVFWTQPHKEERFLFPIYPLIALNGAMTLDSMQKLAFRIFVKIKNKHYLDRTNWMALFSLAFFGLLSFSRILALYNHYGASMSVWMKLSHLPHEIQDFDDLNEVNVCIGKEWHRFPSTFFMPDPDKWKLKFIKSEFKGQLPQPYGEATWSNVSHFNDANKEETVNRFDVTLDECHLLVDLDLKHKVTELEPSFASDEDKWQVLESIEFLDAENSHRIFRAFYVPFISYRYCAFGDYVLLKNRKPKLHVKQKHKKIRHL